MAWTRDSRDAGGRRMYGQITIVQMYRRYAGLCDQEYRELLHQVTGCRSSRAPSLTQFDFDRTMARMEVRAHLAETNGCAHGRRPAVIQDWYYWRRRLPTKQRASSRELWKIDQVWQQLLPYLPQEQRTPAYLLGMAAHAVGHPVEHVHDLGVAQSLLLVDALADRLAHAVRRGAAA